jgi:DHA1 family multidrug resistance protein-like MFS transporter
MGAFSGVNSAATTLAATTTPEKNLSFSIGVIQTGYMAGTLTGPLVGSLLSSVVGYRGCFIFSGIMIFLLLPFVVFGVKENFVGPEKNEKQKSLKDIFSAGENIKEISIFVFILFITQFAMQGNDSFTSLYVKSIYFGENLNTVVALSFGILAGVNILTVASVTRYSNKKGPVAIITIFLALYALCLYFQSMSGIGTLILLRLFQGILIAGILPNCYTCITKLTKPHIRGLVLGITASFVALGSFIGPNASAFVSLHAGFSGIFVFLGLLVCVTFFLTGIFIKTTHVGLLLKNRLMN